MLPVEAILSEVESPPDEVGAPEVGAPEVGVFPVDVGPGVVAEAADVIEVGELDGPGPSSLISDRSSAQAGSSRRAGEREGGLAWPFIGHAAWGSRQGAEPFLEPREPYVRHGNHGMGSLLLPLTIFCTLLQCSVNGPDQVYSWDITYLRSRVRGVYFYLYLVVDIWSRRIVGWAIHDIESGELAAALVEKVCAANPRRDTILWLHSDNGAAMKSVPLLAKLKALGISPSFSRPRVSNDNPYSEALFRTLKYRPTFPSRPFTDIHAALTWVSRFVEWYNTKHLHSAINFVTPRRPTLRPSLQDPLGSQSRL